MDARRWTITGIGSRAGTAACAFAMLFALALSSGCRHGYAPDAPEWVRRPQTLRKPYPPARYFLGFGVVGGGGPNDHAARREAENLALADIAANIAVRIDADIEEADTSLITDGRVREQHWVRHRSRRRVSGVLTQARVVDVFFDDRRYEWHASAVLQIAQASAAATEQLRNAVAEARSALTPPLDAGPLQRLLEIRRVLAEREELEWLITAASSFTDDAVSKQVAREARGVLRQLDATASQLGTHVRLFVRVTGEGTGREAAQVAAASKSALRSSGFPAVVQSAASPHVLEIDVRFHATEEQGTIRLWRVESSATVAVSEAGRALRQANVVPGAATASRAVALAHAREISLAKLIPILSARTVNMLGGASVLPDNGGPRE